MNQKDTTRLNVLKNQITALSTTADHLTDKTIDAVDKTTSLSDKQEMWLDLAIDCLKEARNQAIEAKKYLEYITSE